MKHIIKILLIIFSLTVLGCGLDRSNPLDPENGEINTPGIVTGIELNASGNGAINKYIIILWNTLDETKANGYFIYRSRSYDGTFDLIATINDKEQSSYTDSNKIVPGPYFYKMSAFIYLNPLQPNESERLEGPLNRPGDSGIMVPQ